MKTRTLIAAFGLALALGAGNAWAQVKDGDTIPGVVVGNVVQIEAQVTAIDLATRKVTLRGLDGNVVDVIVGPQVANLPQVKVGDRVVSTYGESLTLKLKKGPGLRSTSEYTQSAKAAPGERPAAASATTVHFVADVTAIDSKAGTIKVRGARGQIHDLSIKDPKVLSSIAVGDRIEGNFLTVVAISVLAPEFKK